jgi:hypothetical protein
MLQAFFDDSCKYQHFVSYPQKSEFQIRHPYNGAESTGCLVFGGGEQVSIAKWHRLKLQQLNQQPKGQLQRQNLLRMPRSRMLRRNPVEVNYLNADLVGIFMFF